MRRSLKWHPAPHPRRHLSHEGLRPLAPRVSLDGSVPAFTTPSAASRQRGSAPSRPSSGPMKRSSPSGPHRCQPPQHRDSTASHPAHAKANRHVELLLPRRRSAAARPTTYSPARNSKTSSRKCGTCTKRVPFAIKTLSHALPRYLIQQRMKENRPHPAFTTTLALAHVPTPAGPSPPVILARAPKRKPSAGPPSASTTDAASSSSPTSARSLPQRIPPHRRGRPAHRPLRTSIRNRPSS